MCARGVRQENGGAASGGSARLGGVMHRRRAKSHIKGAAPGGAPGTSGTRTENRFQGTVLCQISLDQLGGAAVGVEHQLGVRLRSRRL